MATDPDVEGLASRTARAASFFVAILSSVPPEMSERVSTSQLRVLQSVGDLGQTTPSDLAAALEALPSSITRLCDRLVAAGQIERLRAPEDRRVQVLRLTQQGRALLTGLHRHRTEVLAGALEQMTVRDRDALLRGLEALDAALATPRDH